MRTALGYLLFLIAAFTGGLAMLMLAASIRWFLIDWRQPEIAQNLQWALLLGSSVFGFLTYLSIRLGRWAKRTSRI